MIVTTIERSSSAKIDWMASRRRISCPTSLSRGALHRIAAASKKPCDRCGRPRGDGGVGREIVSTAREQNELRAGNDRRQHTSLVGADRQVIARVNHQRRDRHLSKEIAAVAPLMTGLVVT